ncbi:T9SS type A sorting domain-containing protein [Dyadobacter psychrophilus]|uniref:Por secretion system C-terminal sorting domain-containing protein n=1 Tax=Dyadobacter psychrophilus TaxID=651661 RepID=A0A1T5H2P2_9BACT|nr:T9SS type A sorting domain-containing protein [Dyadobacter psychrophilus]SKC14944.1 Por secretion system C-terminal sorting domain-containing protein [Dyadobacter psychrophilus]
MIKICTLLLTLLICPTCFAQWSAQHDVNNLICSTPLYQGAISQSDPEIISDGDGGAIIAWIDYRDRGSHIYAQRIDKDGIIKWQNNGVPICTAPMMNASLSGLQLAVDGSGGAIITWSDERNYNGPPAHIPTGDIYAQHINATGEVQWKKDGVVISDAENTQSSPFIVSDSQGGAFITWRDDDRSTNYSVYGQHINASGTALWTTNGILITSSPNFHTVHPLMGDGNGGIIVSWTQRGISVHQNYVFAQRINSSGAAVWPAGGVQAVSPTFYPVQPDFMSDGLGGFFLTWSKTLNQSFVTHIFAQHVLGNGTLAKPDAITICSAPVGHRDPVLVSDDNGGAIIAWLDGRSGDGSTNYSIYAQRINAAGDAIWAVNGVNVSLRKGYLSLPKIVRDGKSGAIIIYNEDDPFGIRGVHMQNVSSTGQPLWNSLPIAEYRRNFQSMAMISNDDNGAIVTWLDGRKNAPGIYATRILENGTLPVTLVSFKGETESGHSKLTWETSSETNNKGFEIERSIDGRNFKKIGYVEGNGTTSNESKSYRFIDSEPLRGKNYYRLKQLDWDGKFEHSSIVFIQHPIQETSKLYPNPVSNILLVNTLDFKGEISIIDVMGRVVEKVSATTNETNLNVGNLSPGLYLCRFGNTTQQFVKIK